MALAHLLGRVDALTLESRRHPDIGDQHLRIGGGGPADRLVVAGGHPHGLQVGLPVDEGPHSSRTIRLSSARMTVIVPGACASWWSIYPVVAHDGVVPPVGRHVQGWWC